MDIIKFKQSDNKDEKWRVITVINGRQANEFVWEYGEFKGNNYGNGIYPGWLYYELKGGHYFTHQDTTEAEPYIPYVPEKISKFTE